MAKDIKYTVGGDDAPFAAMMRRVDANLRSVDNRVSGAFGGLASSMARLTGLVGAAGALLTGGTFAAGVKHAIDLQDEMSKSAQKAGTSTEAFSSMAYAAKLADVPVETLQKAYNKLNGTLADGQQGQKDAVETFRRLRLDPKNIKDADELLLQLAGKFEQMPDGIKKSALAIDIFGEKLGPQLVPFLNQGRAGIEQLRLEAQKLGVVVSTEAGKRAEEFNDNMTRLGQAGMGAANAIAAELLPSLVDASNYFVKATKEAGLLQGTLISIGALMAKGLGIDDMGKAESRLAKLKETAALAERNLADVTKQLAAYPTSGTLADVADKLRAKLALLRPEILKASVDLARLAAGNPEAGAGRGFVNPPTVKGQPTSVVDDKPPSKEKKESTPSKLPEFELMLAEERRVRAILSDGREMSKQEEVEFWRDILAAQQLSASDRISVERKVADARLTILRRDAKERGAIELEDLDTGRDLALARVETEAAAASQLRAMGQISAEQLRQLEVDQEDQRYQIKRAALQQRLELLSLDPDLSPVERRRILNQILLLDAEHQRALTALRSTDNSKVLAPMANVWQAMESGSERAVASMLNRQQNLRQGLASIWASIRQSINAELAKMIVAKTVAFAKERVLQMLGVKADAAKAASGAAASQAAIPFAGPALALGAMAMMLATVGALSSKVPSARAGWIVPSGMNPLTQLHEEEMVLPRAESKAVQDMAAGRMGGGGDLTVQVRGQAVGDFFLLHKADLVKALKQARRDNTF